VDQHPASGASVLPLTTRFVLPLAFGMMSLMRRTPIAFALCLLVLPACDGSGDTPDAPGGGGSDVPSSTTCEGGPLAAPITPCDLDPLPSTGNPAEDCVRRINQFRWECQCLPPLQRWTEGESCAAMHAEYDSSRNPHDGFRDGICENGGSAQNECPGWGSIPQTVGGCLQLMWDEGPGEPFSAHGHYINMSSTTYTAVACGWHTTGDGEVWAVQNFRR